MSILIAAAMCRLALPRRLVLMCSVFGAGAQFVWHSCAIDVPPLSVAERIRARVYLTHPRFLGQRSVEIPSCYGACEFAWDPYSRANSAGVFHASAEWGRSSL